MNKKSNESASKNIAVSGAGVEQLENPSEGALHAALRIIDGMLHTSRPPSRDELSDARVKIETALLSEKLPEYTPALGEAGESYLRGVAFGGQHALPAMFRWADLWSAMNAAAGRTPVTAPRVAVVVNDGLVQNVIADQGLRVTVLDYDTQGVDEDELHEMPQGGLPASPCQIREWEPEVRSDTFVDIDKAVEAFAERQTQGAKP